jgi:hypothetical protein
MSNLGKLRPRWSSSGVRYAGRTSSQGPEKRGAKIRDPNRVQGQFKLEVKKRSITILMIAVALVISALGVFIVPVRAQWDCDNLPPNPPLWLQAYSKVFCLPGLAKPSGETRQPFNTILCWGIYGHSGVVDFDQPNVNQYEKELYMEAGDGWMVHGHHWEGLTGVCPGHLLPGARIEIWDPNGTNILNECLESNQYRWGRASVTGNYKIKFTPQEGFGYQGKWSLYWQVEFGRGSFCGGGGCGPGGKYPCPQDVPRLVLTARAEGNKVTLEWQSTTGFDLYEIDGAPGTAFGGPTTGFVPLAMLEPSERTYQVGPLDGGEYHFLIWGHRKEGLPVMSNAVTVAITTSKLNVKANCDNARIKVTPPGTTVTGPKFGSFTYPQGAQVELEALDRQLNSCGMLQVQSVFKQWEVQIGASKTTFTTPKIQIALNQDTTATAIYEPAQAAQAKLEVKAVAEISWPIPTRIEISVLVLVNGSPVSTPASQLFPKNQLVQLTAVQQQVNVPFFGTFYFKQWECESPARGREVFRTPTIMFTLGEDTMCTVVYEKE